MGYNYNSDKKIASEYTKNYNISIRDSFESKYIDEEIKDISRLNQHIVFEFDINKTSNGAYLNCENTEEPDTVNPYLWRVSKSVDKAGIAELVREKVYISYGIGTAPIGFIRGKTGWIVQDAGSSIEEAETVLHSFEEYIGENVGEAIRALIISHTHYDHFGGAEVFIGNKNIPIYGPYPYGQSLINDNLYTGTAMSRRLQYQSGIGLDHGEKGAVSFLWGSKGMIRGRVSAVYPTIEINEKTSVIIDGIETEFIPAPDTETLAHMVTYFKDYNVLYLADLVMGTLHNTYTMRGAKARDANYWGEFLYRLYEDYGKDVKVIYAGHGVPHWKDEEHSLEEFLLNNAAAYKFTNDQALLMANKGYTINEIGNKIKIPDSIKRVWYTRSHYGDYTFNARGVYQRYLGFYDGNPVHLQPLPEKGLAEKLIEYIGSEEIILEKAEKDFEKGEYQWVAEITNHLVFNNPNNIKARYLCADALEQLGYKAESGLWRNAYLMAAKELRHPETLRNNSVHLMSNDETLYTADTEFLLDYLGINFDGYEAESHAWEENTPTEYLSGQLRFIFNIEQLTPDIPEEKHIVHIYKGTVFHSPANVGKEYNIPVITTTREGIYLLAAKKYSEHEDIFKTNRQDILKWIDRYIEDISLYKNFNIIEP